VVEDRASATSRIVIPEAASPRCSSRSETVHLRISWESTTSRCRAQSLSTRLLPTSHRSCCRHHHGHVRVSINFLRASTTCCRRVRPASRRIYQPNLGARLPPTPAMKSLAVRLTMSYYLSDIMRIHHASLPATDGSDVETADVTH
jgi:hypothetical protein